VLLTLKRGQGFVPFGAILSMAGTTSIVGDDGEVYVTGLKGAQSFSVQWGNSPDTQCEGQVQVPEEASARILLIATTCQSFRDES
jgi:outer membrane usher protein